MPAGSELEVKPSVTAFSSFSWCPRIFSFVICESSPWTTSFCVALKTMAAMPANTM
jgi:hypothetical protein